ncbi:MAG: translation initiation factor IF-2 subunit beta [Candidatus Altiarchaeales archaeon]|nr:translation initiation factor IF-2 subunit beta [Candidatus Altiarchaeales archaeon]MBD3415985.1 translation initiation factor IF-2 subunit beta [Candidatus Altiarchaeales archaeon]
MDSRYEYDKLLERVWTGLPEKLKKHERFEIPAADTFIEGNTTIIRNFNEITTAMGRKPEHVLKFLSKELAAPANLETNRAIIQRKLKTNIVGDRLNEYAKEYVICHECGRPDTKTGELEGQKIIKCEACGGWWPMRRIK